MSCRTQLLHDLQPPKSRYPRNGRPIIWSRSYQTTTHRLKKCEFKVGVLGIDRKIRFAASAFMFVAAFAYIRCIDPYFRSFRASRNWLDNRRHILITVVRAFLLGRQKNEGFCGNAGGLGLCRPCGGSCDWQASCTFDRSDTRNICCLRWISLFAYTAGRSLSISVFKQH